MGNLLDKFFGTTIIGGGASGPAIDMLIGVAGAALMGTHTRFFFGCAGPLHTDVGVGKFLSPGYGDVILASDPAVIVDVAGSVMSWEVLFLAPGVGSSAYVFELWKSGGTASSSVTMNADTASLQNAGDLGGGIHFNVGNSIGIKVHPNGANISVAPSKVWVALTYLPD